MPPRSRPTSSRLAWLLAAAPLALPAATVNAVSCHIHPPGSTPQNPVGIIGPFASPRLCEQERAKRFGDAGRCHCAADFAPRWLPPPDVAPPGDSPLG